jgi:serine/threonine protein kinase
MREKHTVAIACTCFGDEEEASARMMLRQFSSFDNVCILLVNLASEGEVTRENMDAIMARHERMMALLSEGAADVIMSPDLDPDVLRKTFALARSTWEIRSSLASEEDDPEATPISMDDLEGLWTKHHNLLWESIPKTLMPQLRPEKKDLTETDSHIGQYQIVGSMPTVTGIVKEIVNSDGEKLVVKVIDKGRIVTPSELEGIYREYRFLSTLLKHPNVVQCMDFFHSPSFAYLLFEYAGSRNLEHLLLSLQLKRLEAGQAWSCYSQLASAVQYCITKHVSHRAISMENLVVSEDNPGSYHYKLIDFQLALVAQDGTPSSTVCGRFPCMAPEMAAGTPYIPRYADLWSVGMVLLETAGGLECSTSSLSAAALQDTQVAFEELWTFFEEQGSHRQAVCSLGAQPSDEIVKALEMLLQPDPEARRLLADLSEEPPSLAPPGTSGYVTH